MDLQTALSQLLRPTPHLATPVPMPTITPLPFPFSFPDPTAFLALTKLEALPNCLGETPTKKCKLDIQESPCSPVSSHSSTVSSTQLCSPQNSPIRKPAIPVPDEKKDDAYYERRRRNNTAAKRSRDARRQKEEVVAARAAILQQENIQLRAQVALLKSESAKLQLLLFSNNNSPQATVIPKEEPESESNDETLEV